MVIPLFGVKKRCAEESLEKHYKHTVKFLNFWTLENFAVIILKFKQSGQTKVFFAQNMQME